MLQPSGFIRALRLEREGVADFEKYPFAIPAIHGLERLELHRAVTFFVGENGSGKSTLLEALAVRCGFNAEGGSKNFRFDTRASHSELFSHLTIERSWRRPSDGYFLRAESFYNLATEIENLDQGYGLGPPIGPAYGGEGLHEQSHGQSFFSLLTNRLHGDGVYLFDEPEAALSPQRQLSALVRIHDLVKTGAQFVIATHSPILLAYPDALIYACTEDGIVKTEYTETEHYQVTRDFLANPKRMLDRLFSDDD